MVVITFKFKKNVNSFLKIKGEMRWIVLRYQRMYFRRDGDSLSIVSKITIYFLSEFFSSYLFGKLGVTEIVLQTVL